MLGNDPTGLDGPLAFPHAYDVIRSICVNCKCLKCSKQQCLSEAATLARAFVRVFEVMQKARWRPGDWLTGDYNYGWLCYQWQTIIYNHMQPVVARTACFDIERVGLIKGEYLRHNWVAISAIREVPAQKVGAAPAGCCTVYLDPWLGGEMGVYLSNTQQHDLHNFVVVSVGAPTSVGTIPVNGIYLPSPGAAPTIQDPYKSFDWREWSR